MQMCEITSRFKLIKKGAAALYLVAGAVIAISSACTQADKAALRFTVQDPSHIFAEQPVRIEIDSLYAPGFETGTILVKMTGEEEQEIPFQVDTTDGKYLWFVHRDSDASSGETSYEIRHIPHSAFPENGSYTKEDGDFNIYFEGKPVLTYRYGMTNPPEGVDTLFRRSGYIHPLWSPGGDTLTRIQPPDHYHHYGIWGPWTHTRISDRQVDFWNLKEGQGTVAFNSFNSTGSGPVYTWFNARQNHIDFGAGEGNSLALTEDLEVRVWNSRAKLDRYLIDYTSTFRTPLNSGLLLESYRYGGGIGFRATEKWHKDNCTVLTSEGHDRFTADGTAARWCIVSGESSRPSGQSGILFMSHPGNKEHPEPMRVWPVDGNEGRGDMFFEFCPIRHKEWRIEPDTDYQLKYRMVVFDGVLTAQEAEAYWRAFASIPQIMATYK